MIKIHVSKPGPGQYRARITSEDNTTLHTGRVRESAEAAIGSTLLDRPDLFSITEIYGLQQSEWRPQQEQA